MRAIPYRTWCAAAALAVLVAAHGTTSLATPNAAQPGTGTDPLGSDRPVPPLPAGPYGKTLQSCISTWDRRTDMTRDEWLRTCAWQLREDTRPL
jgi:hypothetical protein